MNTALTCDFSDMAPVAVAEGGLGATVTDMARREITPARMNALQRLILSRMDELQLSYAEVARRGGFTSHATIYALATKKEHRQPPRSETLKRLAKGLDLPLDLVRVAASEAAGYTLKDITTTLDSAENIRIVVAAMNTMSPADQEKMRALALAFVGDVQRERDNEQ